MIVVVSRIRVSNGNAEALADQYRRRHHLVEQATGCLGIEILRDLHHPDRFVVYSRWTDQAAYEAYRAHPDFRSAHRRIQEIPGGIRIDPEERAVEWYEILS